MSKLLNAYLVNPNEKTRARLKAYLLKHPMAVCFATPDEQKIIRSL